MVKYTQEIAFLSVIPHKPDTGTWTRYHLQLRWISKASCYLPLPSVCNEIHVDLKLLPKKKFKVKISSAYRVECVHDFLHARFALGLPYTVFACVYIDGQTSWP